MSDPYYLTDYIRQQYEMLLLPVAVPKDQKSVTLIAKPDDPDLDFANFEILTKFGTKGLVCRYANDRSYRFHVNPDNPRHPGTHRVSRGQCVGYLLDTPVPRVSGSQQPPELRI